MSQPQERRKKSRKDKPLHNVCFTGYGPNHTKCEGPGSLWITTYDENTNQFVHSTPYRSANAPASHTASASGNNFFTPAADNSAPLSTPVAPVASYRPASASHTGFAPRSSFFTPAPDNSAAFSSPVAPAAPLRQTSAFQQLPHDSFDEPTSFTWQTSPFPRFDGPNFGVEAGSRMTPFGSVTLPNRLVFSSPPLFGQTGFNVHSNFQVGTSPAVGQREFNPGNISTPTTTFLDRHHQRSRVSEAPIFTESMNPNYSLSDSMQPPPFRRVTFGESPVQIQRSPSKSNELPPRWYDEMSCSYLSSYSYEDTESEAEVAGFSARTLQDSIQPPSGFSARSLQDSIQVHQRRRAE